MIEQKKNDWLATLFFSPDKTPQDLANLGITTDNSSLQDKDYYKNIPQIQEAFKTDSGSFDNLKFDKYYQDVLKLYNDADNAKLLNRAIESYSYDSYDYFAPIGSKQRDLAPKFVQFANPERRSRGLTNLREASAPTMSFREVGQSNKVFNWDTQKWEDWTPNDLGGLKAITRPTLVLAQWDEDGTHEVDGRIVSHKAGDLKFNEKGDTYYETLGSRSLTGKDILHIADTFTVDGSKWNKYDIFDSDGLDKSAFKTISKTIVKVAPMFLPHVGTAYGLLSGVAELGKLLPVLYKSIEGIATGDISTSSSAQTATNIQAWFSRFDGSLSDKGRQGFFNLENLGKLIEDSSMQLFQQREISKIPLRISQLTQTPVNENTVKWGQGLALAYMAGTSSTEAYDAFKEAGANDRVAGLGMLSVMGAMYGLMNNDYFKDFWFKDTYLDRTKVRSVIKEAAEELAKKEFSAGPNVDPTKTAKGAAKWVMGMKEALTKRLSKMKPGDLMHDSLNEGVEEVLEEVSSDMVKAFYSGLNALGIIDKDKPYDFGITPEDMLARYSTSFVGGTIGGAVFSMHNKWESKRNPTLNEAIKEGGDGFQEIIYLLRHGKENALRIELDRLHKAGKLASTNLSGTEFELVRDGDASSIQYQAAESGNSQNDLVYKQIGYYIDRINEVIKEEGLDLSDAELQFITAQSEITGNTIEQTREAYLEAKRQAKEKTVTEKIIDSGLYSQLFEDWNDLTSKIVQTKIELEGLLTPGDTEAKTPKDIEARIEAMRNNSEYQQLRIKLDKLRTERNAIINGEKNDFYTGQLLFAASPELVNNFVSGFGIHNFTRYNYGKEYDTLSAEDKAKVDSEYQTYSSTEEKARVLTAYNIFTQMQEKMISNINDVAQRIKDSSGVYMAETTQYKLLYEKVNQSLKQKRDQLNKLLQELPEGVSTNDEIDQLKAEIKILEKYLESTKNFKYEVLNPALSEAGSQLLVRTDNNQSVLTYDNYAASYKNYLNYIKSHDLYLDLVDSDLASILQGWVSIHNLGTDTTNWTERVQHTLSELGHDLDAQDPFVINLVSKLSDITSAISSNNIDSAIDTYNSIKTSDLVADAETMDLNLDELVDKILPFIGGDKFIDYLTEVKNLKSQISSSPAYDLIDAASKVTGTDNWEILNLIKGEQLNFLNAKSVEDYIIRDKTALTKLKETKQIINAVSAILDASVEGGFNTQVNPYREQLQKELLPIISVEGNINIVKDLNRISTQLQTLIEISERNQSQKLREQKDIAINMRPKFVSILTSQNSLIKDKFAREFNIDLDQLISELNIPLNITEDNYKEFEEAAIKFETAIFTHVDKLNLSSEDIAKKLTKMFNPEGLISGEPTDLSKDPDAILTDFDQLVYLATILSTPSQNFYSKLKEIISSSDFSNAPIFSQEYAVRIAYSQVLNKEIFNDIVYQISSLAKTTSDDEYIQTKSPLSNFIAVFGGAGVGKTKGVGYLLKLMLPEASILTSAPTRKQTDRLSESIQHDGGSFTKNELIEKILGRPLRDSDIKPIGNVSITSDISLKTKNDNLFGDSNIKILFLIDEVSWYNRIELELISKWAKQNNVAIIALGDYKQNASKLLYNNKPIDTGIEDTYIIKSPDLVAPLRPDNIAKYDNYTQISYILDKVYEQYYNNPAIQPEQLSTFAENTLKSNKIVFKYFEENSQFGGEKFITGNEVQTYIDKFKTLSDDITIITDNPSKYNTVKGIKVVSLNSVQGDEFDYVIIDKDFGIDDSGRGKGEYYKLKDLYTLTQRSRKGTVIVKTGLSDSYESKLDPTSSGNIEMPESQITDFKNWRIDLLSNISNEQITWSPKENQLQVEQKPISEPIEAAETNDTVEDHQNKIDTETVEHTEVESNRVVPTPNISTQEPYTETPVLTSTSDSESTLSEARDDSYLVPPTPVIMPNEAVCNAEDYLDFIQDIDQYHKTSENNIKKYLNLIGDPQVARRITNLLRAYFVYGHYKTDTNNNTNYRRVLLDEINKLDRNVKTTYRNKVRTLLENAVSFHIVPYNQRGLLVARLGEVDIPLLITQPVIGQYNGDIQICSGIKYTSKEGDVYPINFAEFNTAAINTDGLFNALGEPVILSVDSNEINNFIENQQEWIRGLQNKKGNNGRTFGLITADPLLTEQDLLNHLNPTLGGENKFTWTTQHNPAITLIGANWVEPLEKILDVAKLHKDSKFADSIITGARAGQIIGVAYKVAPKVITQRVKSYLNGDADSRRVKIGNTVVDSADIVENTLSQYTNENINITFGYNDLERGFIAETKGEWGINRVFSVIKNMPSLTPDQIKRIGQLCSEIPQFKQGIYCRDIRRNDINGVYRSTDPGHIYVTNVNKLIGNNFKIDLSKVTSNNSEPVEDNSFIDKLNSQLSDLAFNKVISDRSNIETVIQSINDEILSSITSPEFEILVFDGENIITQKVNDMRYMISTYLGIPVETVNISNQKTSEFVPFYVSLQDQINNYVAENKDDKWTIKEFPILNDYTELAVFANANRNLWKYELGVSKYINALLNNKEIDLNTAEKYWNVVSTDPVYETTRQQVDKYLMSKLMNNEC